MTQVNTFVQTPEKDKEAAAIHIVSKLSKDTVPPATTIFLDTQPNLHSTSSTAATLASKRMAHTVHPPTFLEEQPTFQGSCALVTHSVLAHACMHTHTHTHTNTLFCPWCCCIVPLCATLLL